jgi:integrase
MSDPYAIGKLTRIRADGSRYWSYCIHWRTDGKRQRFSLGTTDLIAAQTIARQSWGKLIGAGDMSTVGGVVAAYLGPKDAPRGVPDDRRKREAWAAAGPYWSAVPLAIMDEAVSLAYPAWRQRSANTHRQELSLVRSALRWAVKSGHLDAAPLVTLPAMPETTVGHLSKADFRMFLAGCGAPHVRLFAMLAVTTGGRKSALLQAKWTQVDLTRALFDLNPVGRIQNSKKRATVPLNDMILPALCEAREGTLTDYIIEHHGKPLLDIKKGIAAASVRSGVKCHPHMFRHSAAVWMAEDRVPMAEIAAFLGHRSINVTTRTYARYNPDFLRSAADALTW